MRLAFETTFSALIPSLCRLEGFPKSLTSAVLIADIASRLEGHTLVFQPSREILEQNYKQLCSYGILDCSIYSASFNSKQIHKLTFEDKNHNGRVGWNEIVISPLPNISIFNSSAFGLA